MAQIRMRGVDAGNQGDVGSAPLIALFERDDSIAVPLLSQIRMAGYDVRAARTPVELFDLLGKSFVSLVLVDLGAATAGRREFWVALDAQRRGRALQVMTFRYISPASAYDLEFETSARAIADVEIRSAHELPRIVEGVRQRIPLNGVLPGVGASLPPGAPIPPIGSALGAPAPFSLPLVPSAQAASPFGGAQFGGVPVGAPGANPFVTSGYQGYPAPQQAGQFGQPLGQQWGSANPAPYVASPFNPSMPSVPPMSSMPSVPPMGASVPGAQPWGAHQQQAHPYPNLPPLYASPLSPLPSPGSSVASAAGAPGWENSPFAHPVGANPFAAELEQSPFDQPYAVNPFANESAAPSAPPPASPAPFAAGPGQFSGASLASQYGPPNVVSQASAPGYASQASYADEDDEIQDAWVPPDADEGLDGQTGIVPEVAFQSSPSTPFPSSLQSRGPQAQQSGARMAPTDRRSSNFLNDDQHEQIARRGSGWLHRSNSALESRAYAQPSQMGLVYQSRPARPSVSRQATAAQVPAIRIAPDPAEEALGAVLVEGALLTPSKLDALKGIQQMLAGVNMPVKLGDLALRFKFLSPDQLLAAVLVSRRLVSPQQIASLGRVKRELAATGMDHDLETLLLMFNMLPIETLHELRDELGIGQNT